MILENANVLTMDAALPTASALAIAGGRVLGGVDSREDAIASHAHERINLQGATVIPGLVDAHVHFRAWARSRVNLNLVRTSTRDELLEQIAAHAATLGADEWLLGSGWRNDLLDDREPLERLLHAAAGGRPAALVSKNGHALWCNRHALEHANLALEDLQLPGGVVTRTAEGDWSGMLREESAWRVRRQLPEADLTTAVLAKAMREANRRGVTSLHDMDGSAGFRSWSQLQSERGLSLRVWQHFLADELEHLAALGLRSGFGDERLRIGGLKVFADGTLGSGTAWLHEPELAHDGQSPRAGVTITDRSELERLAREAAATGLPLLAHAIGDAAGSAVVDALEASEDAWRPLSQPPRIEHAQLLRQMDIERCARLGIVLSVQPTHLVNDRDDADRHWGQKRTGQAFAFRSMIDAGAALLLGSDAPIEDLHPLAALHAATTRDGGAHGLADARGAWHPEQTIEIETALLASTAWPAEAVGAAATLGRLTPGRLADLVVLSGDPLSTPIAELEVVATMVGGRWVFGASSL